MTKYVHDPTTGVVGGNHMAMTNNDSNHIGAGLGAHLPSTGQVAIRS